MKQVVIIHGGSSFDSYESYLSALKTSELNYERLKKADSWQNWLASALPQADILQPNLPNKQNAQYHEWEIYFEKLLKLLDDDVSLVGYSLGAMFLAKYLHKKPLQNPVKQLVLIAGIYNDDSNEELGSFAVESAEGLEKSAKQVHLLHSQDDPVSPFSELAKFQADIPTATSHVFSDRNHFFQETLPELVEILNQDV